MISYIVGKLAPNSSHLTRGLVKYVPGRGYFRAVPSLNGDKYVTSRTPFNYILFQPYIKRTPFNYILFQPYINFFLAWFRMLLRLFR